MKIKVLILCSAGITSHRIADGIEKNGREQGLDIDVISSSNLYERVNILKNTIKDEEFNIILLAPQVSYMLRNLVEIADEMNIPVDAINPSDYNLTPEGAGRVIELIKQSLEVE